MKTPVRIIILLTYVLFNYGTFAPGFHSNKQLACYNKVNTFETKKNRSNNKTTKPSKENVLSRWGKFENSLLA